VLSDRDDGPERSRAERPAKPAHDPDNRRGASAKHAGAKHAGA
jgi:hypothetical protein